MTIQSEQDLRGLRKVGSVVGLTLRHMQASLPPGMTTTELDAIGEAFLKARGARPAPRLVYNFPGATCISLNDEVSHGIPGDRIIHTGELVNIDVSAELDGYFADTGATVMVRPASSLKKKLCDCAKAALDNAVAVAQAGRRINIIGEAVESQARRCGFTVIRELGGHGVGKSLHESPHSVPNYFTPQAAQRLTEGLVISIEPFVSTGAQRGVTDADG